MPSDVLCCPYCNTPAAPPPGAAPGQHIPCPRCGESFPYRGPADDDAVTASPPPPTFAPPAEPAAPPAPRRFSNGQVAFLVLGVMAAMALLGLAYALNTQMIRREYDVKLPKTRAIDVPLFARVALGVYVAGLAGALVWGWNRGERGPGGAAARPWTSRLSVPGMAVLALIGIGLALVAIQTRPVRPGLDIDKLTVKAVPPAELAALGYLPDDTDLIVGVHVAEALNDPVGRDLIRRVGLGGAGAPDLEKWTGLKLDDIDHAALGLKLDDELLTRFVLVVRARRPIEGQRVRDALKAGVKQEVDGRTAYPFVLETGLPLLAKVNVSAWFADERTLVIAKTFDRIPRTPKTGLDHLRPELRQVIKERMGPSAQVWAAAHAESWEGLNFFLRTGLTDYLGQGADTFKKVRTLGLWLTADDGVTLGGAFDCADEDGAKALEAYFTPKDGKGLKALAARPDAGPLAREFVGSLKATQHATWVDLQAKASAEAVHGDK